MHDDWFWSLSKLLKILQVLYEKKAWVYNTLQHNKYGTFYHRESSLKPSDNSNCGSWTLDAAIQQTLQLWVYCLQLQMGLMIDN